MIGLDQYERLLKAAASERLSHWIRIDKFGDVWWRNEDWQHHDYGPVPLFKVSGGIQGWAATSDYYEIETASFKLRERAIRAGLEALASKLF